MCLASSEGALGGRSLLVTATIVEGKLFGGGMETVTVQPSYTSDSHCSYNKQSLNFTLGLAHDNCVLFETSNFSLVRGQVTGLVGTNGAGKTSLAKCICSKQLPGCPPDLNIEYISSHESIEHGAELTAEEYINSRVQQRLSWLQADIDKLEESLDVGDDTDCEMIEATSDLLSEKYDLLDQLQVSADENIYQTLTDLGFGAFLKKTISQLSSGWRYKCRLVAAFSLHPDILIIDEPSFLDTDSTEWLVQKVQDVAENNKAMVLLISHKEAVLDRVCDRIWYINSANHSLTSYNCGYEAFRYSHENDVASAEQSCAEYQGKVQKASKSLKNIQNQLESRERSMKNATKANADKRFIKGKNKEAKQKADRSAAAKVKQLKQQASDIEELQRHALCEQVKPLKVTGVAGEGTIFKLQNVFFSYDQHDTPIFRDLSIQLEANDRVLLSGPNGSGKSTLLKLMLNEVQPTSGLIVKRANALYFPQSTLNELSTLHGRDTAAEYLSHGGVQLTETSLRQHLGGFGLQGKIALRSVASLSAGQRVRLWLAKQLLDCPHPSLLIMDEISENLDVETRQSLSDVLSGFAGAVIVVSHDENFCESFQPTKSWIICNHNVQVKYIT